MERKEAIQQTVESLSGIQANAKEFTYSEKHIFKRYKEDFGMKNFFERDVADEIRSRGYAVIKHKETEWRAYK